MAFSHAIDVRFSNFGALVPVMLDSGTHRPKPIHPESLAWQRTQS